MSVEVPLADISQVIPCRSHTTNLVTNLCVEGGLFERLVCARARPPVGGLLYRSLGGILHNRFTEWSTVIALNVSQLFPFRFFLPFPLFLH